MNNRKITFGALGALLLASVTGGCKSLSSHPDFARNLLTNRGRIQLEAGGKNLGLEQKVRQSVGVGKHAGAKFEVEASQYIKNADNPDTRYQRADLNLNSSFYVVLGNGQKLFAIGPNVEFTDKFYDGNTSAKHKTVASVGIEGIIRGKNHQMVGSVRGILPDTSRTEYTQDKVGDIKQGIIAELKYLQKFGYNFYLLTQGKVEGKVEDIERFGQDYATKHSLGVGLGVGTLSYLNKDRTLFFNPNLSWEAYTSNLSNQPSHQLRLGTRFGWKPSENVTLGIEPYVRYNSTWSGNKFDGGAEAFLSFKFGGSNKRKGKRGKSRR